MIIRKIIFLVIALLVVEASFAEVKPLNALRSKAHADHAAVLRTELGPDHELRMMSSHEDELGMTHAHFHQYYKGLRVFGGEIITHTDKVGNFLANTQSAFRGINVNVSPKIKESEALSIANRLMAPKGQYKVPPTAELLIYPVTALVKVGPGTDATSYEYQPVRYHLAYIVTSKIEEPNRIEHHVHIVDAITGAIVEDWNDLHTAAATGTGRSEYSGNVSISTNRLGFSSYELRDMTRGSVARTPFGIGNVVTVFTTMDSGGTLYTDADNTWGDGLDPNPNSPTSTNGQTFAVDVAYGMQVTWDMYKYVLGRNGIDGKGTSTSSRVFGPLSGGFWDDGCFCATFGFSVRASSALDVVGHEMSHGVTSNNGHGGLQYFKGESGGLNESNSDIMGTMVEFYARGGGYAVHATSIPASGGNWTIAEQVSSTPLRYMYKPSLDGGSPDAWSSDTVHDPHYGSGPGNREFYFLSQGASNNPNSNFYSPYLPGGMTGIGNDKAARIHYRALTTYYTANSNYATARLAHINAAADLFGSTSAEVKAVKDSFTAINVGVSAGVVASVGATTTNNHSVPYEFVVGSDGNLWMNYFNGSNFVWANMSKPSTARIGVGVGVTTVSDTTPYAFVIGSDGNLWADYWNGSGSIWTNTGKPSGVGIANPMGVTVVSSSRPYVFVTGSDGNLWVDYRTGSSWSWANLGKPSGTGIASAVGVTTLSDRPYTFVLGSDGNLWTNYWSGSSWVWANMGNQLGDQYEGLGVTTSSDFYLYVYMLGNTRSNLVLDYWDGSNWIWLDAGRVTDGSGAEVEIKRVVGVTAAPGNPPYVAVAGWDDNLWIYFWNGSAWAWQNLGIPSGVKIASATARGLTTINGTAAIAYVVGDDGNLWLATGFGWSNLGASQ